MYKCFSGILLGYYGPFSEERMNGWMDGREGGGSEGRKEGEGKGKERLWGRQRRKEGKIERETHTSQMPLPSTGLRLRFSGAHLGVSLHIQSPQSRKGFVLSSW